MAKPIIYGGKITIGQITNKEMRRILGKPSLFERIIIMIKRGVS